MGNIQYINTLKRIEMKSPEFMNNEHIKNLISCSYLVKFFGHNPIQKIKFLTKPAILTFEKNKYDICNSPSLIPFAVKKSTHLELQQVSHLDPRRDGANAKFSTN
jgi:hypothetical protein